MTRSPNPTRRNAPLLALGLRVVAVVLAVVGLNAAVNIVLPQWVPASWRSMDASVRGMYRLTPQTQAVLERLEKPVTLILLHEQPSGAIRDVARLGEQMAGRSGRVTFIAPGGDDAASRLDLQVQIHERFAPSLALARTALEQTASACEPLAGQMRTMATPLQELLDTQNLPAAPATLIASAVQHLQQTADQLDAMAKTINNTLTQPLPDYAGLLATLTEQWRDMDRRVLEALPRALAPLPDRRDLPMAARGAVLEALSNLQSMRQEVRSLQAQVQGAQVPGAYDEMRKLVQRPVVMVALSESAMHGIALDDMLQAVSPDDRHDQNLLLGLVQEQLAGAMLRLGDPQRRLVILVAPQGFEARGPEATVQQVQHRLGALGYQVRLWQPRLSRDPVSGHVVLANAPQVPEAASVVWLLLADPYLGVGDTTQERVPGGHPEEVLAWLDARLALGDRFLITAGYDPLAATDTPIPLVTWLAEQFAVDAQLDRIVLREQIVGEAGMQVTLHHAVRRFEGSHPVAASLDGMPLVHARASPLAVLTTDAPASLRHDALIQIRGPRTWAEQAIGRLNELSFNPQAAQDAFTTALAVQGPDRRAVIVADPMLAMDLITANADEQLCPGGVGAGPAAWPGNALFVVNSVHWLSDQAHLMAPSLTSLQTPRLPSLTTTTLGVLRLMLVVVLPLGILTTGVWVYLHRRAA